MPRFPRSPARPSSRALGMLAEDIVCDYLWALGRPILERNARLGPLEIDIVARHHAILTLVEVKFRGATSFERGLQSVTHPKRQRLARAADRLWHRRYRFDKTLRNVRFDVAVVRLTGTRAFVEYIPAAFDATAPTETCASPSARS